MNDFLITAQEILDVVDLEEALAEVDVTLTEAYSLLLENGLVDTPEWYDRYNGKRKASKAPDNDNKEKEED